MGGETLRRRVDVPDDELDFPILHDLKAEGATDYFALPVKSALGTNYTVTYATDRVGGIHRAGNLDLTRVSRRLPLLADLHSQRAHRQQHSQRLSRPQDRAESWPANAGHRRGNHAVLWSSDLRGFTSSDRLAGPR